VDSGVLIDLAPDSLWVLRSAHVLSMWLLTVFLAPSEGQEAEASRNIL